MGGGGGEDIDAEDALYGEDSDGGDEDADGDGSEESEGDDVHVASRGGGAGPSAGTAKAGIRVGFEQRRGGTDAAKKAEKKARRNAHVSARPPKSKTRAWVLAKKDTARRKGKEGVRPDSKYTGRKRGPRF